MQKLTNLKNKRIFISGGAGIIGRELVFKLLDLKAKIFVGDIKKCPKDFIGKVKYRTGDLNTISKKELINFKPEIFFHLAATYERTYENYNFFSNNFHNNIKLSNYLLKIISEVKSLKKIVFASTYLIYSDKNYSTKSTNQATKFKEKSIIYPRNLIAASKLYHEQELFFISKHISRISVVCARIFRGYGVDSRDVISRWVRSILKKEKLIVYSEKSSFDYIFSKDTAESLVRMAFIKNKFQIINVGFGKSISISYILKKLKFIFKKDIKIKKIKSKIVIENSVADISYLKKTLNFNPYYNIISGIKEIINHEKRKI
jgi:carbamoyl-phosphate synthase large subunit